MSAVAMKVGYEPKLRVPENQKTPPALAECVNRDLPRAGIEPATPGFSDLCSTN